MLFCHLQNLPRMLYLEPPHSCNVSPLSSIDWSLCLLIRDSGLCLDFRLELIQDRPSSINQSLNRGTKPRHTHTAQFTLVMGFIRYAPYPQTTPNDWTIEIVYTFYLQKLTTTDEWEKIQPALFPHDAHGRVRVEASCRHLLVAVRVLSDLNLHNECMFK